MIEFIKSISEKEIKFISKLDCKQDVERHKEALNKVIFEQAGAIGEYQVWFPYEVIELGANALVQGHEKEFTICTMLILLNSPDEKKKKKKIYLMLKLQPMIYSLKNTKS